MFTKGTATLSGNKIKLLFNTTTDAFKYYSKHKNGKYWFAKQITENKYVLIEFTKFADDITVSAIKTASKDKASIWIGDLFLNDLKIKNE